jgi:hypothetical protein
MAEIAAPYFSGNDLNGQPGDANLSGVQANFDPAVKTPLAALQNTADRIDAENFNAHKQQQQQQRQFQHDILVRQMENEHQDKILKYHEGQQNRQQLFNMFNETGATAASLQKDPRWTVICRCPFSRRTTKSSPRKRMNFRSGPLKTLRTKSLQSGVEGEDGVRLKQKRTNASLAYHLLLQAGGASHGEYIRPAGKGAFADVHGRH